MIRPTLHGPETATIFKQIIAQRIVHAYPPNNLDAVTASVETFYRALAASGDAFEVGKALEKEGWSVDFSLCEFCNDLLELERGTRSSHHCLGQDVYAYYASIQAW